MKTFCIFRRRKKLHIKNVLVGHLLGDECGNEQ